MSQVTPTRNLINTTVTGQVAESTAAAATALPLQTPSVLTQSQRPPHLTATQSTQHVRRANQTISEDQSHPLATGSNTANIIQHRSNNSNSSNNTNRSSHSLNSQVRRFFNGSPSLRSSNSPSRNRQHHREQSPQSYSHQQHHTHQHHYNDNNNNTNTSSSTTNTVHSSSNSNNNTHANHNTNGTNPSRTPTSHPPAAPSSTRRSKYPMALLTQINQVYDGPVRGTAIIDSSYVLDSSPVFEMITTPLSTHRLKRRLDSNVRVKSNSISLYDNPVTANSSSDNNEADDADDDADDDDDEEEETDNSEINVNGNSQSKTHNQGSHANNGSRSSSMSTKRQEPQSNLQISVVQSIPSELLEEEQHCTPIMIEADNNGRLYRSSSSRLSVNGSFRLMKGSTSTTNNNSEANTTNNNNTNNTNSQSIPRANQNLPNVVCTSKARKINVTTNAAGTNEMNSNFDSTHTLHRERQQSQSTSVTDNNRNLQHSRSQQQWHGTNLFSLHRNEQLHTSASQPSATDQGGSNVNNNQHNNIGNVSSNANGSRVENESVNAHQRRNQQQHQQQYEPTSNSNNIITDAQNTNISTSNNDNHNEDNVLPMTSFQQQPQSLPELANNITNDNSQQINNVNMIRDSNTGTNETTSSDHHTDTDTLPSCPCPQRSEPLQVLDGDYVLFSDSFIESDPSSIVAVMTHEFKQTCTRCNTMPHKPTNAERTRLQAVREVLAEAEVQCRPLFRRVPSQLVYGSASYISANENPDAERSIHHVIEDHEEPIQESQREESTTQLQNDKKINLQKAISSNNGSNTKDKPAKQDNTKTTNTNECLTIRQMTQELEQNTPRVWHDHHDDAEE